MKFILSFIFFLVSLCMSAQNRLTPVYVKEVSLFQGNVKINTSTTILVNNPLNQADVWSYEYVYSDFSVDVQGGVRNMGWGGAAFVCTVEQILSFAEATTPVFYAKLLSVNGQKTIYVNLKDAIRTSEI